MTPQPLPRFRSLVTHHCITGSMRHVYEYHDYPISEDMLLGLGEGVGFVYWHMKDTLPMYGGRANVGRPGEEGLERAAGRRTGVRLEPFSTASAAKAEKALLDLLARQEPVMVMVDMGFLPYFDLPDGFHFGGHAAVVAGYDAETRQVLMADRDEPLHPVALEDLAKARGSKCKPFPPMNAWYAFDFAERHAPEPAEVKEAIRKVAVGMLEPPIANLGVKGIRKAAIATLEWPKTMTEDQVRQACFNLFIFIDATGGTGGGIFRYMYGRFLAEAAQITGDERLSEVGEQMREIGDRWQEVAAAFRAAYEAPNPSALLPEIVAPLPGIAQREQAAWESLREMSTRR